MLLPKLVKRDEREPADFILNETDKGLDPDHPIHVAVNSGSCL